jgi:methionyl-tRNA synthetase
MLDAYQADAVRYYVAAVAPETADTDFSWEGFFNRVNGELLAAWGNLVNRMLGFAFKRFDGKVPTPDALTSDDQMIIAKVEAAFETVGGLIEQVRLREALYTTMGLVREANGYLDRREPWKRIKEDAADTARSVYTILRVIDNLNILLAPYLPFSAQLVHQYLGYDGWLFGEQRIEEFYETGRFHKALVYDASQATGKWGARVLPPGQPLREPRALYVKLDESIIELERAKLGTPRDEHEIVL